jgi:hypothetical protein
VVAIDMFSLPNIRTAHPCTASTIRSDPAW